MRTAGNPHCRVVLRGGIGRFYDFPYTNATVLFPAIEVQSNFGQVYGLTDVNGIRNPDGSFFRPGQPLPPGGALPPGAPPARSASKHTRRAVR